MKRFVWAIIIALSMLITLGIGALLVYLCAVFIAWLISLFFI